MVAFLADMLYDGLHKENIMKTTVIHRRGTEI